MNNFLRPILISVILLLGCEHVEQGDPPKVFTTEDVDIAVIRFNEDFGVFVDSTLEFDEGEYNGFPGKCIVQANHIVVNKEWWINVQPETRQALIFHELGHCLLGLGHDDVRGIMSDFIGHNANSYAYEYEEGVEYMQASPCEFGCNLHRIQQNRSQYE